MTNDNHRFPFGRVSSPRPPRVPDGPCRAFVLGVYPSALHVRWTRPDGVVTASIAVDDEPVVFWTGEDARDRVQDWMAAVGWRPAWGAVSSAGNGSSGRIVQDAVLTPLKLTLDETFVTDCVNTYFVKRGTKSQSAAINEKYAPFAREHGLPEAKLPFRPSARELVELASTVHASRLRAEILSARPPLIVTLGNEALAVLKRLAPSEGLPDALSTANYGVERRMRLDGLDVRVLPLVHPGQRGARWREAHDRWIAARRSS